MDILFGGTRARLTTLRRYVTRWNAEHPHNPLAEGFQGLLEARSFGVAPVNVSGAAAGEIFEAHSMTCRWRTRPESVGFEFVGWADDVAWRAIERTGWFTGVDPGACSRMRGCVYRIRTPEGMRYVPGYREGTCVRGDWQDESGATEAVMSLSSGMTVNRHADGSDHEDAAIRVALLADGLAESQAEDERAYDAASVAGRRWADNKGKIKSLRRECLAVVRSARDNIKGNQTICTLLREKIRSIRVMIHELVRENVELASGADSSTCFDSDDPQLRLAFTEGACENYYLSA